MQDCVIEEAVSEETSINCEQVNREQTASLAQQNTDESPENNVVPLARYRDRSIHEPPHDLYIPPAALKVFLEAFEGPLDLLLYLIRKSNTDILDIPIAEVTRQYMEYINLMSDLEIELAADYLVMAAVLAEIKSRLLLPQVVNEEGEIEDPRAELVRKLQVYEQFKAAAMTLSELPRYGQDFFPAKANAPDFEDELPLPDMQLQDLIMAMKDVLLRNDFNAAHEVVKEPLSIRERMSGILDLCQGQKTQFAFTDCFRFDEGRMGVVVTFIAMLELLRQGLIVIVQAKNFAPIYIKAKTE